MAGTALQTAHRAIVPTTLVLSGLTYLAALIASSVELDFMRALNTRLCAPPDRRTSTAPPPPGCHPYLVVPWALAAPTAALSLLFVAGGAAVHRHRRDQDRPAPRRALVVALALLLAGLWLAVLCVGWIRPRGAAVRYYVPARDLAIAVEGGPGVPLTGGFAWAVGFYQAIFADGSDLFLSAARMWQRTARTGLAGVILCNMALWVPLRRPGGMRWRHKTD